MATLNQKIDKFIEENFPDIDYSILGGNQDKPEHRMGLKYEYFVSSIEYYTFQKSIDYEEIKHISTLDMRGIDGCFFVLNKQLFIIPEYDVNDSFFCDWKIDLEEIIKKYSSIELDFYFLQSKSNKTELDKLKGFCDAVYDVFCDERNDLTNHLKVQSIKHIFDECCKKDNKINLILKFCSIPSDTRKINQLKSNLDWVSAMSKYRRELKSNKFESVDIQIKSGQDYQDKLETILSPNQRNYTIKQLASKFIEIQNENINCHIGYLNLFEIKEIIENEDGELDDIFFDNIRYFEGLGDEGSVNSKIYKSLNENQDIFHILHNGITITAHTKHYNQSTGEFEIQAFSVINGCQTCNLIWLWIIEKIKNIKDDASKLENQEEIEAKGKNDLELFYNKLKNIKIPVKLVITSNPNLRSKVTESANTQNPAESIQLIAISEEAKLLQDYINDNEIRQGDKLYYERLTNQFPTIGKANKITTEDIFRAFYSTFKKNPHELAKGYGRYERERIKSRDFLNPKYDIQSFYISTVLFNYLERYLKSQFVNLLSLRHHFLLLLCISINKNFDSFNPEKTINPDFIDASKTLISDKQCFNQRINKICEIAMSYFDFAIDNSTSKSKVTPKSYYTEEGTNKMISIFKENFFNNATN